MKKRNIFAAVLLTVFFNSTHVFSHPQDDGGNGVNPVPEAATESEESTPITSAQGPEVKIGGNVNGDNNNGSIWDNLGFGIGLSYIQDLGKNDRVKSAELVNGVVRVTDEQNGSAAIVFEGHYFFHNLKTFGHGPFVAVQAGGSGDIITSVALGWMFGLRKHETDTRSWNLGIGLAADPNVQILGDGLTANDPLPEGETAIRFKEKTQFGLMFVFSASWN